MAYTGKYPTRPDAQDCSFFIRTGTCKFGSSCKFNHPVLTLMGIKAMEMVVEVHLRFRARYM
ncbi:putative transcription factor C3H family [Helianthus annuus]|nr:putative transcription factor C3H family [Helianthus annuus]KAJ0753364.1 putative transcription factor C3H family [Helianthus annuus]